MELIPTDARIISIYDRNRVEEVAKEIYKRVQVASAVGCDNDARRLAQEAQDLKYHSVELFDRRALQGGIRQK